YEVHTMYQYLHYDGSLWFVDTSMAIYNKTELSYPEFIKLFEEDTCPKCRTKDFENCHSIKCPMRKEELLEVVDYPGKQYQPLFDHLSQEHGLILHESEMNEIIRIVNALN